MRGNTTRPESFPLYLALNAHFLLYPYMYACMYTYMICAHIYILPCIIYIFTEEGIYLYLLYMYEIYFEISENFLEKFFRYSRLRPNFFLFLFSRRSLHCMKFHIYIVALLLCIAFFLFSKGTSRIFKQTLQGTCLLKLMRFITATDKTFG